MLLIGKPSILMGHLYHGYVSHNQRVLHLPAIWLFTQLQGFQHHRIKADPLRATTAVFFANGGSDPWKN
jgi:hypothetical protein